jgi:ABC-type multidrug transport system permease subunit
MSTKIPDAWLAPGRVTVVRSTRFLARSVVALSQGDVTASWRLNRTGWLVLLAGLVRNPVPCLPASGSAARTRWRLERLLRSCTSAIVVAVLAVWAYLLLAAMGAGLGPIR